MAERIRAGALTGPLRRMQETALTRAEAGLRRQALGVQARAMVRVREGGQHRRGTPTPASRGRGPAVVTGDLGRAIAQSEVERMGMTLRIRVGPAAVPHRGGRSTSGVIGEALETGGRYGARYPFMGPATDDYRPLHAQGDGIASEFRR